VAQFFEDWWQFQSQSQSEKRINREILKLNLAPQPDFEGIQLGNHTVNFAPGSHNLGIATIRGDVSAAPPGHQTHSVIRACIRRRSSVSLSIDSAQAMEATPDHKTGFGIANNIRVSAVLRAKSMEVMPLGNRESHSKTLESPNLCRTYGNIDR
jgi:hypothetical protein